MWYNILLAIGCRPIRSQYAATLPAHHLPTVPSVRTQRTIGLCIVSHYRFTNSVNCTCSIIHDRCIFRRLRVTGRDDADVTWRCRSFQTLHFFPDGVPRNERMYAEWVTVRWNKRDISVTERAGGRRWRLWAGALARTMGGLAGRPTCWRSKCYTGDEATCKTSGEARRFVMWHVLRVWRRAPDGRCVART